MKICIILLLSLFATSAMAEPQQVSLAQPPPEFIREFQTDVPETVIPEQETEPEEKEEKIKEEECSSTTEQIPAGLPEWKRFFTNYSTTLATGISTGLLTGALCAYGDISTTCPFPLSWIICWGLREGIIKTICDDLKETKIPHNKTRAHLYAYMSDWAMYITLMWYNDAKIF